MLVKACGGRSRCSSINSPTVTQWGFFIVKTSSKVKSAWISSHERQTLVLKQVTWEELWPSLSENTQEVKCSFKSETEDKMFLNSKLYLCDRAFFFFNLWFISFYGLICQLSILWMKLLLTCDKKCNQFFDLVWLEFVFFSYLIKVFNVWTH